MAVRIDITGQIFGGWQVIGSSQVVKRGTRYWDCKCLNCGKIHAFAASSLRAIYVNNQFGCKDCAQRATFTDLTGQQIGDWQVLRKGPMKKGSHLMWWCKCKCGTEKTVYAGMLLRTKQGLKGSSGCTNCQKNEKIKHRFHFLWNRCKSGTITRARQLTFTILPEDIEQQLEKQNYLCALSGEKLFCRDDISVLYQHDKTNISVDRIDSSIGYEPNNIQLVTKQVNLAKQDYSQEEFIQMCNKVAKTHPR